MADAAAVVGLPEMTPVDGSMARPVGSVGDTDHEVTVPVTVGVSVVIATLTGRVSVPDAYDSDDGAAVVSNGMVSAVLAPAGFPSSSVNVPAATEMLAVPALSGSGVNVAEYVVTVPEKLLNEPPTTVTFESLNVLDDSHSVKVIVSLCPDVSVPEPDRWMVTGSSVEA